MKKSILSMAVTVLILVFSSCIKDDDRVGNTNLDASKTSGIKKGEPITFRFSEVPDGSNIKWEVIPDKSIQINAVGNTATILFNMAGLYNVSASSGQLKAGIKVSVQDSIYTPGGTGSSAIDALKGDMVSFIISKIDSMGINGLMLSFSTNKKYPCLNNLLLFDLITNGSVYKINLKGVFKPGGEFCTPGEDKAKAVTSLYPVSEGNHVFEVVLDGITYTGSFVKSGTKYTFAWPYTNGVTISPLVIN